MAKLTSPTTTKTYPKKATPPKVLEKALATPTISPTKRKKPSLPTELVKVDGKNFIFRYMQRVSDNSRTIFKNLLSQPRINGDFCMGVKNFVAHKGKFKSDNSILVFKWNIPGLTCRIPAARSAGLRTLTGVLVNSTADMKEAICNILCTGPTAGVDLSGHHDMVQFLPAYHRDVQMEALMAGHGYLRHHALGYTGAMNAAAVAEAPTWPDIVEYMQILTVTAGNAAVGPVDLLTYFKS